MGNILNKSALAVNKTPATKVTSHSSFQDKTRPSLLTLFFRKAAFCTSKNRKIFLKNFHVCSGFVHMLTNSEWQKNSIHIGTLKLIPCCFFFSFWIWLLRTSLLKWLVLTDITASINFKASNPNICLKWLA